VLEPLSFFDGEAEVERRRFGDGVVVVVVVVEDESVMR
jgi:hypothetical protein